MPHFWDLGLVPAALYWIQDVLDTPVQVQPVAGHVQTHAELKQESVGRVQQCQVHQQTHGGTTVCQHVQHGTKLCT